MKRWMAKWVNERNNYTRVGANWVYTGRWMTEWVNEWNSHTRLGANWVYTGTPVLPASFLAFPREAFISPVMLCHLPPTCPGSYDLSVVSSNPCCSVLTEALTSVRAYLFVRVLLPSSLSTSVFLYFYLYIWCFLSYLTSFFSSVFHFLLCLRKKRKKCVHGSVFPAGFGAILWKHVLHRPFFQVCSVFHMGHVFFRPLLKSAAPPRVGRILSGSAVCSRIRRGTAQRASSWARYHSAPLLTPELAFLHLLCFPLWLALKCSQSARVYFFLVAFSSLIHVGSSLVSSCKADFHFSLALTSYPSSMLLLRSALKS